MRKYIQKIILFTLIFFSTGLLQVNAEEISEKLSGKILLQVEANGEAWYVYPQDKKRYYLGRPDDAFNIMRDLGLGVSNADFDSFGNYAPSRLSGRILLKVEDLGKAYYVNPDNLKMYYLGRPQDAFNIMRELGLGISNANLNKISLTENIFIDTSDIPAGFSKITGRVVNTQGNPFNTDLIYLLLNQDNEVIFFDKNNTGYFVSPTVANSAYRIEAWFEEDLEKKGRVDSASAIYANTIALKADTNLGIVKASRDYKVTKNLFQDTESHICAGKKYSPCQTLGYQFYCTTQGEAQCRKIGEKINIDEKKLSRLLHSIINYNRRKLNKGNLDWNIALASVSENHSQDMEEKNYFDYLEAGNCDLLCRFNQATQLHSKFSENLALNYSYKSLYDDGMAGEYNSEFELAKAILANWTSSKDSSENLFSSNYTEGTIGISISDDGKVYSTFNLSNFFTDAEKQEIKNLSLSLTAGIDSQTKKIEKTYEWITENIAYDAKGYTEDNINYYTYTSLGAWRNRLAVCQGYAELLRVMLRNIGIKTDIVTGTVYDNGSYGDHAWNKLNINGEDLYLDVTWDTGYIDNNNNFVKNPQKNYFLIPKECIAVDHYQKEEEQLTKQEQKAYINNHIDLFNTQCIDLKNSL